MKDPATMTITILIRANGAAALQQTDESIGERGEQLLRTHSLSEILLPERDAQLALDELSFFGPDYD